jgi:hypothetical protein
VHVLTKIFIVLVSLLAVMLVPLVVVYAHNENSYKSRLVSAEDQKAAANMALTAAEARAASEKAALQSQIEELRGKNSTLGQNHAAAEATIRNLEGQVAANAATAAEVTARIAAIESSIKAGQQLTETLVTELRELRALAVNLERQKVELDEALRDVTTQLDVAEQARRALAEELARVKQEHASTLTKLGQAIAKGFNPDDTQNTRLGVIPDISLTATVVRVEKSNNKTLVEIDAGQRDGVKKDWIMTIGDGGDFVGTMRIITVDIDRSVGEVTLEKGHVRMGQQAVSFAGRE